MLNIKMKSITEYIQESFNDINNEVKVICDLLMSGINYGGFKEVKENTPEQFDKYNEQILIQNFNHSKYKALTTGEYYDLSFNNPNSWNKLSKKDKTLIDATYGDIIIVDENNKPKYFIDLKVSNTSFVGAVSLGSLSNFIDEGIYLCVSSQSKKYIVVSHKELIDAVKINPRLIYKKSTINNRKGFNVKLNGENYNSEDFVGGKTLEKMYK